MEQLGGVHALDFGVEAFEQQLATLVAQRKDDPAFAGFLGELDAHPQQYCHFGATLETMEERETLSRLIRESGKNDPELRGRIEIASVLRPGDPGHVGSSTTAFVRTDVFSSNLLTFGQIFEVNYYAEDAKEPGLAAAPKAAATPS